MMPSKYSRNKLFGKKKIRVEGLPDDPVARCGYFFISTGHNDPFIPCCKIHDDLYGDHPEGVDQKKADMIFLSCMLKTACDNKWLRFKAYSYYRIVRMFGWMFW